MRLRLSEKNTAWFNQIRRLSQKKREDEKPKDIFDRSIKITSQMDEKQHNMRIETLLRQCPGATRAQAETVLVENANNMPKSLKSLKLKRIFLLAPESECREILRRSNGDPDRAYSLLQKSCK